jgi:hypothetical protein
LSGICLLTCVEKGCSCWLLTFSYRCDDVVALLLRLMCDIMWLVLLIQDLAGAIDEVDVVKFTDIVKEYDNMSRIVCCFSVQPPSLISVWC